MQRARARVDCTPVGTKEVALNPRTTWPQRSENHQRSSLFFFSVLFQSKIELFLNDLEKSSRFGQNV